VEVGDLTAFSDVYWKSDAHLPRFFSVLLPAAPLSIAPVKSPRYNFSRVSSAHSNEQLELIPGQVVHSQLPLDFTFHSSIHSGRRCLRLKTATSQKLFFP